MRARSFILFLILMASACGRVAPVRELPCLPDIYPDYKEVTIPANVAPLNFSWLGDNGSGGHAGTVSSDAPCRLGAGVSQPSRDGCGGISGTRCRLGAGALQPFRDECGRLSGTRCRLNVRSDAGEWQIRGRKGLFSFSRKMWKKMVSADEIEFTVLVRKDGEWVAYAPFKVYVPQDLIDPWLSYRLMPPGYEMWNFNVAIYQRCLENYDERAMFEGRLTDFSCCNCHSYCNRNPEKMLFHNRQYFGGTLLVNDGAVEKLNTRTDSTQGPFVYPYWHPSGRYVTFSNNETILTFFTSNPDRIEVYDNESDVVVYDIAENRTLWSPLTKSPERFETFPTFSPDGRWLYFCSAEAVDSLPGNYRKVKYALMRIAFNPEDGSFGDRLETVFDAPAMGKSVSFPRISPDGRWLAFTLHKYGNFSIWHRDADIWMLDLERLGECSCEGGWNGAGEGCWNGVGEGGWYENGASVVRNGIGEGGWYENRASAVRNGVGEGGRYENGASAVRNGCSEPVGTRKGSFSYETAVRGRLVRAKGDFRTASSTDGEKCGCTKESPDCCAAWPATALNSDETESYHCWSSNGRWLVFSSRRDDGLFTRPYVAYIDSNGVARKPFMLPQKNPKEYYDDLMYSYNIPELMTGPVTVSPRKMAKVLRESPGTDVGL